MVSAGNGKGKSGDEAGMKLSGKFLEAHMLGCWQSEIAENTKFIALNEELAGKLHELGRQINVQVNETKARNTRETIKSSEDDRGHNVARR